MLKVYNSGITAFILKFNSFKQIVSRAAGIAQVTWPEAYTSCNNYFLSLMIKGKGHNIFKATYISVYSQQDLTNPCDFKVDSMFREMSSPLQVFIFT